MSEDGTPDESKEWEDLEGIEQNMYPEEDPHSEAFKNKIRKLWEENKIKSIQKG